MYAVFVAGAFLHGCLIKWYDEIVDNDMVVAPWVILCIQALIVILYTFVPFTYPLVTVYVVVLFLAGYACTSSDASGKTVPMQIDNVFWRWLSYYAVAMLLVAVVYHRAAIDFTGHRPVSFAMICAFTAWFVLAECKRVPEEYSRRKLHMRVLLVLCFIWIIFLNARFKRVFFHETQTLMATWFVGYFVAWIVAKAVTLDRL